MIVIGLTGSIGTGKSTTAAMFAAEGVPVISADEIVHELYAGEAVAAVAAAFPGTVSEGRVDRQALGRAVLDDEPAMRRLEALIHPLVRAAEQRFVDKARREGAEMAVIDIPLLFETGAEQRVDTVVVVTCDPALQRERVLARPGMSEEKFAAILARQMPDAQKRARADHVIDTGRGMEAAARAVRQIIAEIAAGSAGCRTGKAADPG